MTASKGPETHKNEAPERPSELLATLHGPQTMTDPAFRDGAIRPRIEPLYLGKGTVVGRYVVDKVIGRGGMGVVYAASDLELDRTIALKLLADGDSWSHSPHATARLLREAQAMARLEHPNVVRVYDVGTHEGRVFIAMEMVDGGSLRDWARAEARPWEDVLEYFVQAGRGLAAAHRAGLVHRDFKPDNVMLTKSRRVKVMDFGLARATDDSVRNTTPPPTEAPHEGDAPPPTEPAGEDPDFDFTRTPGHALSDRLTVTGSVMGTPAYMPPEQHISTHADARSDQFAFAVSMWEALYGQLPFQGKSHADIALAISSNRITPLPGDRYVPGWLHDAVKRAMSPKPADRWESMDTLLGELQRERGGARRSLVAGFGFLGLAGILGLYLQSSPEAPAVDCTKVDIGVSEAWNDERAAAVRQAFAGTGLPLAESSAEEAVSILTRRAQAIQERAQSVCESTHSRHEQSEESMDLRMACLGERQVELRTLASLFTEADEGTVENAGKALVQLEALSACDDVSALRDQNRSIDPQARAQAAQLRREFSALSALSLTKRNGEGIERAEAALESAQCVGEPLLTAEASYWLSQFRFDAERDKEAFDPARDAVWKALEADDGALALKAALDLTRHLAAADELGEAEAYARFAETMALKRGSLPAELASLHAARGTVAMGRGDYERAREQFAEAMKLTEAAVGTRDLRYVDHAYDLGRAQRKLGQFDDALASFTLAADTQVELLGPRDPAVANLWNSIANVHFHAGRVEEAAAYQDKSLELMREAYGERHPRVAPVLGNHASTLYNQGRFDEAIEALDDAISILVDAHGEEHASVWIFRMNQSTMYWFSGDFAAAEKLGRRVLSYWERTVPEDHPELASALDNLAASLASQGKYNAALPLFERALPIWEAKVGPRSQVVATSLIDRSRALIQRGTPRDAIPFLERVASFADDIEYPPYDRAEYRQLLARALRATQGDRKEIERLEAEAIELFESTGKRGEPAVAELRSRPKR